MKQNYKDRREPTLQGRDTSIYMSRLHFRRDIRRLYHRVNKQSSTTFQKKKKLPRSSIYMEQC